MVGGLTKSLPSGFRPHGVPAHIEWLQSVDWKSSTTRHAIPAVYTQRSMNRVVAQQELERQNFRVRGSGGDAVFLPSARWLCAPFAVTGRLNQGIMTPPPP